MTTINIGKRMREEAYLRVSQRKTCQFKVSKEAEQEYASFINSAFDPHLALLCKIANDDKRKTILQRDVMELFARKEVTHD